MRLAFAGTPQFAVPALDALAASRHRVLAVFTRPDSPQGRGRTRSASPVKRRAIELSIAVHQPASFQSPDALRALRDVGAEVLVVVAYGLILPAQALAVPALGCLNIHASLLPRWRGAAPIQRAILAGDAQTGITIMRMDSGLDTGPMLGRRAIDIGRDDAQALHDRLAALGGELICETVDALAAGQCREEPQPASGVTYASKIEKSEALIDWHEDAQRIGRKVRAFNPWPVAETRWNAGQLRIWEAAPLAAPLATQEAGWEPGRVVAASADGLDVACGAGVLRILRLQLPGRKPVAAGEFLNAHTLAGARFGSP